jgi:predicted ribosome quality control (RQC) complex YloA/Tae2 family protein
MNFRQHTSKQGTLFLAGKDAESNEALVVQTGKDEDVLHTAKPGSPFVNIKGKTKKGDLKEAAIFCAIYSQDWKKNKKDVLVHVFKGKDIFKEKGMKEGTFGVKKFKEIKVKKSEIERWS